MNETSEKPKSFSTSIYVTDKASFQECKRLLELQGLSLSTEIMGFISGRLNELKGGSSTIEASRRFEELKAQHFQLGLKVDKFKIVLEEKKAYDSYLKKFGEALGYDPGKDWETDECLQVIGEFLRHSADDAWKRAETRFLMSCKAEGLAHTFLDLMECHRERKRIERKLLEMRADPEELARLDELARQEEEQEKLLRETRKLREAEEARKEREEEEKQDRLAEAEYVDEEEEEQEGFIIDSKLPHRLTSESTEEEGTEEDGATEDHISRDRLAVC